MKTMSLFALLCLFGCNPTVTQLSMDPGQATLTTKGQPLMLHAQAKDKNGAAVAGAQLVWSSGNPVVATVDPTGRVSALKSGSADITAATGEIKGVAHVTVEILQSASISPAAATLMAPGKAEELHLLIKDDAGKVVAGPPTTWSSSNPKAAIVDGTGKVEAEGAGAATITAHAGALMAVAQVTVESARPEAKKKRKK